MIIMINIIRMIIIIIIIIIVIMMIMMMMIIINLECADISTTVCACNVCSCLWGRVEDAWEV